MIDELPIEVEISDRGLIVVDERGITDEKIFNTFTYLSNVESASKWAIADLYVWCMDNGLDPFDYIDQTKISMSTVRNRAVAARCFPPHTRRWNLSIDHYIIASNSKLTDEERYALMDAAEQGSLPREALRELVRETIYGDAILTPTFSLRALHMNLAPFFSRSRRVYQWAVENGLPDNLTREYNAMEDAANKQMRLLWDKLES